MPLLQHTSLTIGDSIVNDDLSVITDGNQNPNAVVTHASRYIQLDVNGNGIIDANATPTLATVFVTRERGERDILSYRVVLLDWAEDVKPGEISIAIYRQPDGIGFLYATDKMIWDDVLKEWYTICPSGFEPSQSDIFMGFLFGSMPISAFTMHAEWNEHEFSGGGDYTLETDSLMSIPLVSLPNAADIERITIPPVSIILRHGNGEARALMKDQRAQEIGKWYDNRLAFNIDSSWPLENETLTGQIVQQWHQQNVEPCVVMNIGGPRGAGRYELRAVRQYFDLGPVIPDVWTEFNVKLKHGLRDGVIAVFRDGVRIIKEDPIQTVYPENTHLNWSAGIYKPYWRDNEELEENDIPYRKMQIQTVLDEHYAIQYG